MPALFHDTFPAPPADFNMAAYVLGAGDPDACALQVVGNGSAPWSFADIRQAVAGIARGLRNSGLRHGDRLMLRQGNSVIYPLTYLACIWAGILPVPTAAALTRTEVAGLIAQVTPTAIATSPGIAVPKTDLPLLDARTVVEMQTLPPLKPEMGDPNRPAYIVFTSGSSGTSRPVCHAHRAVWARRMMWDGWYGLRTKDRLMHAGAFNWTYTMGTGLMDPWAIGATALIPAEGINATDLPALLAAHKVTMFAAAPGVYRQMLRAPMPPLPHLRHGLSAGEALPDVTRAAWQAATGTAVHEALGMSECSTYVSGSPARPAGPGIAGYPQPGRHLSVRAGGAPVDYDTPGELCLHKSEPGLMLGYWTPNAGPSPIAATWFGTGDHVSMARDGAITYLGRRDDMMNAGGFRVSPLEVEAALALTPGLSEVAACEVRLNEDTSVIAAFHVGGQENDLRAAAQTHLARYKRPRLYFPHETLPRNANGKLNRRALRTDMDADTDAETEAATRASGVAKRSGVEDEGA